MNQNSITLCLQCRTYTHKMIKKTTQKKTKKNYTFHHSTIDESDDRIIALTYD